MSRKVSSEKRSPGTGIPGRFDYDLGYVYDVEKPHQARRIGDYYFGYDDNGNIIRESDLPPGSGEEYEAPERIGDVRVADRAWGLWTWPKSGNAPWLLCH